mgnify:CR=1 FL=1
MWHTGTAMGIKLKNGVFPPGYPLRPGKAEQRRKGKCLPGPPGQRQKKIMLSPPQKGTAEPLGAAGE